jgi:hypothetical protein
MKQAASNEMDYAALYPENKDHMAQLVPSGLID